MVTSDFREKSCKEDAGWAVPWLAGARVDHACLDAFLSARKWLRMCTSTAGIKSVNRQRLDPCLMENTILRGSCSRAKPHKRRFAFRNLPVNFAMGIFWNLAAAIEFMSANRPLGAGYFLPDRIALLCAIYCSCQ